MTHIDSSTLRPMLQDSLAKGQKPRLTVTSNSMAPLFRAGDQVILEAATPNQLHPGDIVTISDNTGLLTHRIWTIEADGFLTRGDHLLVFDALSPPEAVLGRVVGCATQKRILSLQTGSGKWLNRHLAALARKEYRWLSHAKGTPTENEQVPFTAKAKIIHRFVFAWAVAVTFIIKLATRIKTGETTI
ncbi:MAG: hypothetical protein CSB13_07280 [Chloroflexi bacterium]|nr:MAG: hypothetical protein CSB13_07280 [Chloroflexota bacterium]